MARPRTIIHADVEPIGSNGTEADMMCWVRVTQLLMQSKARRDARLADQVLDGTHAETKAPPTETTKKGNEI